MESQRTPQNQRVFRTLQVSKWGNSLVVRIPSHIVKQLGLQEGDNVDAVFTRKKSREEALRSLKEIGKKLPSGFRFERLKDRCLSFWTRISFSTQ